MNKSITLKNLIILGSILIILFFLIVSCNKSGSNELGVGGGVGGGGGGSISGNLDSTFGVGGSGYVVHNNAAGGELD